MGACERRESNVRRREPLHQRLMREAGLASNDGAIDTRPQWQETGVHGIARPREWDVTVTAQAELTGDAVQFVALPDGTLLVEDGPDESLEPLATAVEQTLKPPYRARAMRQSADLWAVQARRIRVVEIPNGPDGDSIELVTSPEGMTLSVDDSRAFGSVPELEGLGDVVRATRLDGDLWEIQVERL